VPEIAISVDTHAIEVTLTEQRGATAKAIPRALNRAIKTAATFAGREIAKDMGLKVGDAKRALTIREATVGRHEAALVASRKRLPLIAFGARGPEPSRGKGRGVTYRLGTGGRGRAEHAFLATMPGGHRGVYARSRGSRLPIYELRGPSTGKVMEKLRPQILHVARDAFEKNFAHELEYARTRRG
jgi:Prophage minor tail protein Z (GPZ)